MKRREHLEDIEAIRKALVEAGFAPTLADCIAFAQLEWLDAIEKAICQIGSE